MCRAPRWHAHIGVTPEFPTCRAPAPSLRPGDGSFQRPGARAWPLRSILARYTRQMFDGSIGPDSLRVLRSTRPLIEHARSVSIDSDAVETTATLLVNAELAPPEWETGIHFRDDTWRTAAWVLVLDALNFCFWSWAGELEERWTVDYEGTRHDGYWALVAALRKAIDRGQPLWDADYLLNARDAELIAIFDPAEPGSVPIPQLERRVAHLREVGVGLHETPIEAFITEANGSAVALAESVRRRFPSFDDVVWIDG